MVGNSCQFHSFYDTPGWHILKVPNFFNFHYIPFQVRVPGMCISFWSLLIFVLSNYC